MGTEHMDTYIRESGTQSSVSEKREETRKNLVMLD